MELPVNYGAIDQATRRAVREAYVQHQGGNCHYCNGPLASPPPADVKARKIQWTAFPPQFLKYPVHLHYSHETGLTIGAVHALCNAVLWQYHGE